MNEIKQYYAAQHVPKKYQDCMTIGMWTQTLSPASTIGSQLALIYTFLIITISEQLAVEGPAQWLPILWCRDGFRNLAALCNKNWDGLGTEGAKNEMPKALRGRG